MKRLALSLLLVLCLLAGLITPIFATESVTEEFAAIAPVDETTAVPDSSAEGKEIAKRDPKTFTTSAEGLAFIADFFGKNPKGTSQLIAAEKAVNAFITREALSLTQAQFDALVDFAVEKGSNIYTQGYKVEKVIAGGSYTDVALADAFFSWVKDGIGVFSEKIFAHRLREVKLFLYGSYSGACDTDFRYVIYDANGGTLDDNTVLCYTYNIAFTDLPIATRNGYSFAGWYTKADAGMHLCNGYNVSGNYRVYAHWSKTAVEKPNEVIGGETQTDPGTNVGMTLRSDVGAGVTTYPNHTGWPKLPALKVSEAGVEFIKKNTGFSTSTGYGTYSGAPISVSNPITLDQADYILRYNIGIYEKAVDKVIKEGTVHHTQNQYDAILSLTCHLGTQWMQPSYNTYSDIFLGGCDELSFINAIGSWCSSNGTIQTRLCQQRMEEADLYLNADYMLNNAPYRCLTFNGNGGTASDNIEFYIAGTTLQFLPTATKYGSNFIGWFDKTTDGILYTVNSTAPDAYVTTLYAYWKTGGTTCTHPNTLSVHKDAFCNTNGFDRVICVDCNKIVSEAKITALGHDIQKQAAQAPTCTNVGWEAHDTCSRCNYSTYKEISPIGHDLKSFKAQAPTCTNAGWEAYQGCTRCTYTTRVDIPALGHDFKDHDGKAPTCTEGGWAPYQTCNRCEYTSYAALPALGHNYVCGVCLNCFQDEASHTCSSVKYDDLELNAWYHPGIDYVLDNGLMNGTDAHIFEPNSNLTRAMLVTILYRAEGEPDVSADPNPFDDVPAGEWYTNAVVWAAKNGIVNGMTATTFAPNDSITREQIATILYRYAGFPSVSSDLSAFPDADHVSPYAEAAMKWAVSKGIINGKDGMLAPADFATRAQIATILFRYLNP